MIMELKALLYQQLSNDEGYRKFPYTDTVGKLTIGIGHNLTDRGLSDKAISFIFDEDVTQAEADARKLLGNYVFENLTLRRKAVIVNMAFNLGIERLSLFVNTLLAIKESRFGDAAHGMRNSKWATQVGDRAKRLAQMMELG